MANQRIRIKLKSYDHRLIDGADAVRFLQALKERLQTLTKDGSESRVQSPGCRFLVTVIVTEEASVTSRCHASRPHPQAHRMTLAAHRQACRRTLLTTTATVRDQVFVGTHTRRDSLMAAAVALLKE